MLRWAGPDPSPSARLELSFSDGNLVAPVNDCRRHGKVAAALMEKIKAGDLFAKTPEIHKLEVLADKLPK